MALSGLSDIGEEIATYRAREDDEIAGDESNDKAQLEQKA
jgi:hypothetical protein